MGLGELRTDLRVGKIMLALFFKLTASLLNHEKTCNHVSISN